MKFQFLNPESLDDESKDAIKSDIIDKMASEMATAMAINAKMKEVFDKLDSYATAYEKRKGGEDRSPFSLLMIDTIAHLSCALMAHDQMLKKAVDDGKDPGAIVVFSHDIGLLRSALLAVKAVT